MVDASGMIHNVPADQVGAAAEMGLNVADEARLKQWDQWSAKGVIPMTRDGEVFNVPKEHVPDVVDAGGRVAQQVDIDHWDELHPTAFVKGPDGRVDAVTRKDADRLIAEGYAPASEDDLAAEYGDMGSQAGAGLEGFAQGFTTHVFKPMAAAVAGDQYIAAMDQRERFNPGTHLIGELGGALTQAIVTEGAGLGAVAREAAVKMAASQGALRGAMTKIAGEAIAGAVDAGSFGAVQRGMDALTGDHPADAESILLGAGEDALLGAALGGAVGTIAGGVKGAARGVESLFSKRQVAQALQSRTLPEALDTLADKATFSAVLGGSNKGAARKAAKQFGVNGDAVLGKWAGEQNLPLAEGQAAVVEALQGIQNGTRERLGNLVGQLDATGMRPDLDDMSAVVTDFFDALKQQPAMEGAANKALKNAEFKPVFNAIMKNDGEVSFNDLWKMRQKIDQLSKFDSTVSGGVNDVFRDLRTVVEEQFQALADDAAQRLPQGSFDVGGWLADWNTAKRDFRMSKFLGDAASSGLAGQQGNNSVSLRATMAGLMGGDVVADAVSKGAQSALGGIVGGALGGIGGTIVGGAAAQAIATHGPRLKVDALRGLARAAEGNAGSTMMKGLSKAKNITATAGRRLEEALLRGPRVADEDEKDYSTISDSSVTKAVEEANQVASGVGPAADKLDDVSEAVADGFGVGIADALFQKTQQRSQFLVDVAGSGDKAKIGRTVAAMKTPGTALKRLAEGRANPDEVAVIKNLYPKAFDDLKRKAVKALQVPGANRKVSARLKRLFDIGDDPASIQAYQQVAMAASQGAGQPKASGMGPSANVNSGLSAPSAGGSLKK